MRPTHKRPNRIGRATKITLFLSPSLRRGREGGREGEGGADQTPEMIAMQQQLIQRVSSGSTVDQFPPKVVKFEARLDDNILFGERRKRKETAQL